MNQLGLGCVRAIPCGVWLRTCGAPPAYEHYRWSFVMKKILFFQVDSDELAQLIAPAMQGISSDSRMVSCPQGVDQEYPNGYKLIAFKDIDGQESVRVLRVVNEIQLNWFAKKSNEAKAKLIQENPGFDFSNITSKQAESFLVTSILAPSQLSYETVMAWDFSKFENVL